MAHAGMKGSEASDVALVQPPERASPPPDFDRQAWKRLQMNDF